MIKLKSILIKEEMSPREKREFEAAVRGIETNISFISQEANRLIKILNKVGMRNSAGEINKSFKKHILDFQKDINNISSQHLQEDFPGITNVGAGYSNPEAQKFSVDAVNKAAKEIGKAQQRAVSIFTSDMKNKKFDNMDLARSIKQGNIRDASLSKRELLSRLYYDVRDRFNKYNRRKK